MIQKVPSGLSISDYRRNGLRYFRGDRGREPSSRCDAVDVRQIDLRLAARLWRQAPWRRASGRAFGVVRHQRFFQYRLARRPDVQCRSWRSPLDVRSGAQDPRRSVRRLSIPQMIKPLLEGFDPARRPLLFSVEFWPVARQETGRAQLSKSGTSKSAICASAATCGDCRVLRVVYLDTASTMLFWVSAVPRGAAAPFAATARFATVGNWTARHR